MGPAYVQVTSVGMQYVQVTSVGILILTTQGGDLHVLYLLMVWRSPSNDSHRMIGYSVYIRNDFP